jgi:hypothetical protein
MKKTKKRRKKKEEETKQPTTFHRQIGETNMSDDTLPGEGNVDWRWVAGFGHSN